jgi:hypothetical protein
MTDRVALRLAASANQRWPGAQYYLGQPTLEDVFSFGPPESYKSAQNRTRSLTGHVQRMVTFDWLTGIFYEKRSKVVSHLRTLQLPMGF